MISLPESAWDFPGKARLLSCTKGGWLVTLDADHLFFLIGDLVSAAAEAS